jgi:hypothetical protein
MAPRARIIAGRVNASLRKITSGSVERTSRSSHSQKATGLVWGLSTRKTRTPWAIQCRTTRSTSAAIPAGSLSKLTG